VSDTFQSILDDAAAALKTVDSLIDAAAPLIPDGALLAPIVDAVTALAAKLAAVSASKAPTIAAEVSAADVAAEAALAAKFPPGTT